MTTCDHDSPSTRFARHRHGHHIRRIDPGHLGDEHAADALWIIDTLDHLADPDTVLGPVLAQARIVITEDLRENRAHGQQRFHHRRSYPDIARVFGRYDLFPTTPRNDHELDQIHRSPQDRLKPTAASLVTIQREMPQRARIDPHAWRAVTRLSRDRTSVRYSLPFDHPTPPPGQDGP